MRRVVNLHRSILSVVGVLSLSLLTACESKPSRARYDATFAVPGQPRSMVMDSPRQQRLQTTLPESTENTDYLPWYLVRNDARLSTEAGYVSPMTQEAAGYTYDRQSTSNGRVYDSYSNTVYRRFRIEAERP
jgi:hypothetical protein